MSNTRTAQYRRGEQRKGVSRQRQHINQKLHLHRQTHTHRETDRETLTDGGQVGDQLEKVLKCNAFIFITACPQKYAMQKAQRTERGLRLSAYLCVCCAYVCASLM